MRPHTPLALAEALGRAGQRDEARRLLEQGIAEGYRYSDMIERLAAIDPGEVEARLRARIEVARPSEVPRLKMRLAELLAERGDRAGALELWSAMVERDPSNDRAFSGLLALSPAEGEQILRRQIAAGNTEGWRYGLLGDCFAARGEMQEAVEAWLEGWRRNDSSHWNQLKEHAPERLVAEFEARAQDSTNDEHWGDVADAYWSLGRREEALAAWNRAWQLDPSDSEWYTKLLAVQQGRDPLDD